MNNRYCVSHDIIFLIKVQLYMENIFGDQMSLLMAMLATLFEKLATEKPVENSAYSKHRIKSGN